ILMGNKLINALDNDNLKKARKILSDPSIDINCQDAKGRTPLMIASERGNLYTEIVEMLLRCPSINVNLQDKNLRTALIIASSARHQQEHIKIVDALLRHPTINVHLRDRYGKSALIYASYWGHFEIVDKL